MNAQEARGSRSRLQLSISLRISIRYALLLLRTTLTHLLCFALGFALLVTLPLLAEDRAMLRDAQAYLEDASARPVETEQARYGLWEDGGERMGGSLVREELTAGTSLFVDWDARRVLLQIDRTLSAEDVPYRMLLQNDLSQEAVLLGKLLLLLLVLEIARLLFLIRRGQRVGERMLQPIAEITQTAQRLSGNNLSERISMVGVKDELKDLARVINEMLDRIEAAYNSQKQFVSDASHELRTPLAVIQGYADMLARWGKDDPAVLNESVSAISSETAGMKELIEKLLFLARHDKRTLQLETDYFDAAEMLDELARDTLLIDSKHAICVGAMESCIVRGDRNALKQAVRVLVDNAIKYTGENQRITLSCRNEGAVCRMTVSDAGMGIASDALPHIFDRFYRADEARSGDIEGHGLGLSIARIIVLSHGGKIEVQSKLGVGSRFHLLLPM